MSILINDMEMPGSCGECRLCLNSGGAFELGNYYCCLSGLDVENLGARLNRCPLVPVPPHGDLIDRDALAEDGWVLTKQVMRMGGYAIHELPLKNSTIPVIIPTEGGET